MNYCLINTSGKINKFFVDNWFFETIIKENKDKVQPSANSIQDKFLKEIVMLNIISLVKTKEVITRESGTTNFYNHHSTVNNTINILKLVKLLVKDSIFEKKLGRKCEIKTLDLFAPRTTKMVSRISLHKY